MKFIDSHAHLTYSDTDRTAIAAALGRIPVSDERLIIDAGVRPDDLDARIGLLADFPDVRIAAGLHPHDAKDFTEDDVAAFEKKIMSLNTAEKRICAVGETGLDYYRNNSPADRQRAVFSRMLTLAKSVSLPVLIHSRDAADDTIDIVRASGVTRGVFHCFSGGREFARKALDLGYLISFAGNITYKNADAIREASAFVPADRFTIETDCPFLAPVPMRGTSNEPSFAVHTAACIAVIRGTTTEDVMDIAYRNTLALIA
ncbi:MAG: TatD family hydrolase [Spirochaetota bacterium]